MKNWEICRDDRKRYFYICSDDEVYTDEDGDTIHFDTFEDAEEFLQDLNETIYKINTNETLNIHTLINMLEKYI